MAYQPLLVIKCQNHPCRRTTANGTILPKVEEEIMGSCLSQGYYSESKHNSMTEVQTYYNGIV